MPLGSNTKRVQCIHMLQEGIRRRFETLQTKIRPREGPSVRFLRTTPESGRFLGENLSLSLYLFLTFCLPFSLSLSLSLSHTHTQTHTHARTLLPTHIFHPPPAPRSCLLICSLWRAAVTLMTSSSLRSVNLLLSPFRPLPPFLTAARRS